ncbi:serine/threonine-protein kinase [Mycolicibacterium tusciae]|uniref:serine/threonine-protein kinase n=1 Tax=Mycolicibacterium tusciae TaxID=75922 RepID=UPI00024A2218|nr:serine/threonine-protein kinase [Mycolicibacterium tusciae]
MPLADGQEIAGYTIVRSLGAGGMGEVYLAQHPRLPRYDALKVLSATVCADSEYRERFNREADIAATLWHQHIVEVHDRGDVDGQLWISMDYVEGTDAHRLLAERYPDGMPPEDVVRIIAAVADALDYAHDQGLLHRDVKPANILLANPGTTNERIMLADFGIARRIGDTNNLTGTNMTVGTVAYAAPEQLMGDGIDGRADQYALAATAFQLLTGAPPFQHANPAVVISQHLTGDIPAIGTRRPELSNLGPAFTKALAKSPHERFDKCIDFARALAHRTNPTASGSGLQWPGGAAGDLGKSEPTMFAQHASGVSGARHAKPEAASNRRLVLSAATAVVVLGLAAGAYVLFDRGRDRPAEPAGGVAVPVVVVGAECGTLGEAGLTEAGVPAYCAHLPTTGSTIWSLYPEISSPTVTPGPNDRVLPAQSQQPVLVCMEQTGQSHIECHSDILEVKESATPTESG